MFQCGCGREIPSVTVLMGKTRGVMLVCTDCGARGTPIEVKSCGGCENCDGEGFCNVNSKSYQNWLEFKRHAEEKGWSLYSDWMDQTF